MGCGLQRNVNNKAEINEEIKILPKQNINNTPLQNKLSPSSPQGLSY